MRSKRVGVVGAGTMGAGIAQIAALGGYQTAIYELDSKALQRRDGAASRCPAPGSRAGPLE